jgi:hypothetical protein
MPSKTIIQLRRDTAANWTTTNPVLAAGETGYETDTGKFKVGDGTTTWTSLAYNNVLPTDSRLSDARTPTAHTHAITDVTGLQTALDAKVDESSVTATSGIVTAATGWGSLSAIYTERNGIVMLNITAIRTGGDIASGNITNNTVCTVASGYRPIAEALAGGGPNGPVLGAYIGTAGNVVITAIGTGISTSSTVDINATYIKA